MSDHKDPPMPGSPTPDVVSDAIGELTGETKVKLGWLFSALAVALVALVWIFSFKGTLDRNTDKVVDLVASISEMKEDNKTLVRKIEEMNKSLIDHEVRIRVLEGKR